MDPAIVDWTDPVHDREKCRAVVNVAMNSGSINCR
jgi:hypothetical protein